MEHDDLIANRVRIYTSNYFDEYAVDAEGKVIITRLVSVNKGGKLEIITRNGN